MEMNQKKKKREGKRNYERDGQEKHDRGGDRQEGRMGSDKGAEEAEVRHRVGEACC